MKHLYRIFIIALLIIFLTACTTTPGVATNTSASSSDLSTAPVILTVDSTSEQIQHTMIESAGKWANIRMDGVITWYDSSGSGQPPQIFREQTWIDQLTPRFRAALEQEGGGQRTLKLSDGQKMYNVNLVTGQTETTDLPEFAHAGQYIPPVQEGVASPNPLWGQIGTPLSEMAFSADFAQNKGTFKPLSLETIAGRETLVVEWTYVSNSLPSFKAWLDTRTAVILKLQEFAKEGGTVLQGERVVNNVAYNESFEASLFDPASLPKFAEPTQIGSQPFITGSGLEPGQETGELYFFTLPHQAGQSIQLVRVSASCVTRNSECPAVQTVSVPFPFSFTLTALSWSPDGSKAAFAYPDNPNGTPTKLFVFDPASGTWTSLAEFPYIDPPFWSPDGTWIAFREQDGMGGEDVYVVHRDGTELKSVSANLPPEGRPYIMDGWYTENVIMRSALLGNEGKIYLVRVSDGSVRPMFETLLTKAAFITAPDSSLLAYDDYNYQTQSHVLRLVEPDGANPIDLANFTGGNLYPIVWSPDSSKLAFVYQSFGAGQPSADVLVVNRDGKGISQVYKGVTVGRVLFSPRGRYLIVEETTSSTGGHLFVIDLATLEKRILEVLGLTLDYDWYAPSWRP
jgi:Tol biopolymer transport system component